MFLFGVVSHQVADILWHSLGIDQGFLVTMGKVRLWNTLQKHAHVLYRAAKIENFPYVNFKIFSYFCSKH